MNKLYSLIVALAFVAPVQAVCQQDAAPGPAVKVKAKARWRIPVVLVKYFPVDGDRIDKDVTGDWGESLEFTRKKVDDATALALKAMNEGSRYHGYKDPMAQPSLEYDIVASFEFLEGLPGEKAEGSDVKVTDYHAIMQRIGAKNWVEKGGVKEIWIWAYHGGKVTIWESNMASRFGDISNSNRDPKDLPIFDKTYTVYHYNYQRSAHEVVHNHFHQLEHLLNFVDGRYRTPKKRWSELLFWGKFVGSDESHKIVSPGAGWCHYPPNAEKDYDYTNKRYVMTDIEDWKPNGSGVKKRINSDRWHADDLEFYVYWFQNLPGHQNGLVHKERELRNWWIFKADWDGCMKRRLKLTH